MSSWSRPMPREYWETKLEDYREGHQLATGFMEQAKREGRDRAAWIWGEERKRLVAVFVECKRKLSR